MGLVSPAYTDPPPWDGRKAIESTLTAHKLGAVAKDCFGGIKQLDTHVRGTFPANLAGARCLWPVSSALGDPQRAPDVGRGLVDSHVQAGNDLAKMLAALAKPLDQAALSAPELVPAPAAGSTLAQHLDYLEKVLVEAARHRALAFAKLTEGQQRFMILRALEVTSTLRRGRSLEQAAKNPAVLAKNPDALAEYLGVVSLAGVVDWKALRTSARILVALADAGYLSRLEADLARATADPAATLAKARGELVAVRATTAGAIAIGGRGENHYLEGAALVIDLGGDDTYGPGLASVVLDRADPMGKPVPSGVSCVIDLGGADKYQAGTAIATQGGAVGGVALLLDRAGDDVYQGGLHAQGSGLFGIGILADLAGNDTYEADSFSQGAGAFGLGLLYDAAGNDTMTVTTHGAGFGLTMGVGCLHDRAGDDVVVATGAKATPALGSLIGTEGGSCGFVLGAGLGLVGAPDGPGGGLAPGGVGIAIDGGGNDKRTAGEIALGAAHFYAMGIFVDTAGNDAYECGAFGAGAAVQQAVGVFLDLAGNDTHTSRFNAHLGAASDIGIAFAIDASGDDVYESLGERSQGYAEITSYAVFYDGAGKDRRVAKGKTSLCYAGHTADATRKSISLAVVLDRGKDADVYEAAGEAARTDGVRVPSSTRSGEYVAGHALFVDEGP